MSARRVLVVAERLGAALDGTVHELLAAARSLGTSSGEGVEVAAALLGDGVSELADELAQSFERVHVFDDARLDPPDGDLYARVLAPLVIREAPFATLIPHTNTGMELAPLLAVAAGTPLIADCLRLEAVGDRLAAVRTLFGGKVHARVRARAAACGAMATVRPGAFAAAPSVTGTAHGEVCRHPVPDGAVRRIRSIETVAAVPGAVDLRAAEIIVAVGRGIEEALNLPMIESLADALGAEVGCTRPVVDRSWLDKSRQVSTSGVQVEPRVYLAIGLSGSFQHLGGVKGRPFLAAINKDAAAPIFSVADVGIVGDLFDIVPRLERAIRERKG